MKVKCRGDTDPLGCQAGTAVKTYLQRLKNSLSYNLKLHLICVRFKPIIQTETCKTVFYLFFILKIFTGIKRRGGEGVPLVLSCSVREWGVPLVLSGSILSERRCTPLVLSCPVAIPRYPIPGDGAPPGPVLSSPVWGNPPLPSSWSCPEVASPLPLVEKQTN